MKKFSFVALSLLITMGLLTTSSCEKDSFLEEAQPSALENADLETGRLLPEINEDQSLFDQLPDSLTMWLREQRAKRDPNEISLRRGGIYYTYGIRMDGHTLNGQYRFKRNGCLQFRPTYRVGSSLNFNNGRNPFDMALFSGKPIIGDRGSIWFMTNTAMCALYDYIGCINASAAMDVEKMRYDSKDRLVIIDVDGNFVNNAAAGNSIAAMLNIFNTTNWSAAYRVISGRIVIQFSEDFKQLAGAMRVYGSSFGTAPVAYFSTFAGYATNQCNP